MRTCLLVFLFLTALCTQAQKTATGKKPGPVDSSFALTFSPLALAQIDYTLMAGVEYGLRSRFKLVADAGWIFASSIYGEEEGAGGASGFLIRPGVKYLLSRRLGNYLHGQIFYKQVTHRLTDWLEKEVVNGSATYEQQQDFRFRRKAVGFNLILGRMIRFHKRSKWFVDVYAGAGVRVKSGKVVGESSSRYSNTGSVVIGDEGPDVVLPSLPAGVRLFWLLR